MEKLSVYILVGKGYIILVGIRSMFLFVWSVFFSYCFFSVFMIIFVFYRSLNVFGFFR